MPSHLASLESEPIYHFPNLHSLHLSPLVKLAQSKVLPGSHPHGPFLLQQSIIRGKIYTTLSLQQSIISGKIYTTLRGTSATQSRNKHFVKPDLYNLPNK
jgi:hypothetical protein